MKYDEFAFFNNQLAGMLKAGLPLEGSLRQLSGGMKRGKLRAELQLLEEDLKRGTPLPTALESRELPALYKRLVQAGAKGDNLQDVLVLLADYYQKLHNLATKLKGLMVYPIIVLTVALALTVFLTVLIFALIRTVEFVSLAGTSPKLPILIWVTPAAFLVLLIAFIFLPMIPVTRRWLRWRLPGFKDAAMAQLAGMLSLLLRNGTELDRALGMMEQVEAGTVAELEIRRWRGLIQAGSTQFIEIIGEKSCFPPLFKWLVAQGGEDLASGFARAAEVYGGRAEQKAEMLLNTALPLSVMTVGAVVAAQAYPFIVYLNQAMAF